MIEGWIDKTSWFMDEDGKPLFAVIIEHPKETTPPAELVELIELYRLGYRRKRLTSSASDRNPDPSQR